MLRLGVLVSSLALASAMLVVMPAATASADSCPTGSAAVTAFSYKVGTTTVALNTVNPGDHVVATFTVAANCTDVQVSFVSYNADPNDLSNLSKQTVFSQATGHFATGEHTLAIDIPCAWQADLVTGAVITHFDESTGQTYSQQGRLVDAGSNKGVCVTPSPSPTQSVSPAATVSPSPAGSGSPSPTGSGSPSPTSSISSATNEPSPNSSVLGASVVAPATGNGSEAFAGFIAVMMVLTGIAVLAEVRRRRQRD